LTARTANLSCPLLSMMDWFDSLSELVAWTQEKVASGNGGCCSGNRCRRVRDLCLPEYRATTVVELEQQRELLGLALAGQVVVIGLRLVTGQFGEGAMNLVVFVWGNRARCTLNSGTISSFVVAGSMVTCLDTFSLLHNIFSNWGFGIIAFPFEQHLGHNLTVVSALLAPLTGFLGVQSAFASMITPDMLFQQCRQEETVSPPVSTMVSQALHNPWLSSWMSSGPNSSSSSWLFAPSAPPSSPQRTIADSAGAGYGLPELTEQSCHECGTTVCKNEGWSGTGAFAKCVYCYRCWVAWKTPNRIG